MERRYWECARPGCGRITDHLILRGGVGVCRECALELEGEGAEAIGEALETLMGLMEPQEAA